MRVIDAAPEHADALEQCSSESHSLGSVSSRTSCQMTTAPLPSMAIIASPRDPMSTEEKRLRGGADVVID
jgi:hypothetical protein